MWMRASEEQLKAGVHAIKLENHEGLWMEKPDMWSKYLRRPDSVEDLCFAQFAKMYKGAAGTKDEADVECEEVFEDEEGDVAESSGRKFHFIMTFRDNGKKAEQLPEVIELLDPCPGERPTLKKRTFPAALRFHKHKKDNDHRKYMLSELMLYTPLRRDLDLNEVEDLYNEEYNGVRKIQIVKSQVMEHLESVTEARYHVEQLAQEGKLDLTAVGEMMDATGEQENEDCEVEGQQEHEDFLFCNPDDIKENQTKNQASVFKQIVLPPTDELRRKTECLDEFQKEVVNIAVTFARNVVKARKHTNQHPKPPLLMVNGGAGAGKSTVINVVAMWMQKILQVSGDSPDQPFVLKTAFTGCAASNIEGLTLHGAFSFSFSNQHYSLSDKLRDQRRTTLKNLKLVIIDEISMVKSDMLYMLDLRLQEVKEKIGVPFGGVAIFAFGDMMQLKPCMGNYIFDEPKNHEFKTPKIPKDKNSDHHTVNPKWEMFAAITLENNHRQGRDRTYADTLNRIRISQQTNADIQLLTSRIRPASHEDVVNCSVFIGCKRKDIAERNFKYIKSLPGKVHVIRALHFCDTQANFKPEIEKKDGAVGSTSLQDELLLKVGAKLMIVHNIDTSDLLTNGQMGTLVEIIKTVDGKADKLVVRLNDERVGDQNRRQHPALSAKFPGCILIERVSIQYSLRKKSGEVAKTATVIQFPVKLAFAITAHKVQGQSILYPTTVAMDLESVFEPAQAYVMLSRVQCLEQLFIVDKLSEKRLNAAPEALKELKRLEKISFNKVQTPWHEDVRKSLKIATLNCAGILPHFRDIVKDNKLLKGEIINLLETSLPADCDLSEISIHGFKGHFVKVGNGKGIATFVHENVRDFSPTLLNEKTMQISMIELDEIDVISVYRYFCSKL